MYHFFSRRLKQNVFLVESQQPRLCEIVTRPLRGFGTVMGRSSSVKRSFMIFFFAMFYVEFIPHVLVIYAGFIHLSAFSRGEANQVCNRGIKCARKGMV